MENNDEELKIVLPSRIKYMVGLEKLLRSLMTHEQYEEDIIDNVWFCFHEAMINAIVHGNSNNPQKKVFVNIIVGDQFVRIEISDQGKGFNLALLQDPTENENLQRCSGRGIFLMKCMIDTLHIDTAPGSPTHVVLMQPKIREVATAS